MNCSSVWASASDSLTILSGRRCWWVCSSLQKRSFSFECLNLCGLHFVVFVVNSGPTIFFPFWLRVSLTCAGLCVWGGGSNHKGGILLPVGTWGGGEKVSWHFNFAREISRFKLTAKFPTRNSGFSVNFSHASGTHCGPWRRVMHSTQGAPRNFPQRNLPPRI